MKQFSLLLNNILYLECRFGRQILVNIRVIGTILRHASTNIEVPGGGCQGGSIGLGLPKYATLITVHISNAYIQTVLISHLISVLHGTQVDPGDVVMVSIFFGPSYQILSWKSATRQTIGKFPNTSIAIHSF